VAGYEALRQHVVEHLPGTWRFGHGLLESRGMAAWMRSWRTTAPQLSPVIPDIALAAWRSTAPHAASEQIVAVLAQMALART
jgi:hypothetical protein